MQRIRDYLKSPHPIGSTTPNQAIFSTLNRTEAVDSADQTAVTSVNFSDTRYFNYLYLPDMDCTDNPNYPDTNMPFKISQPGKIGGTDGREVKVNDIVIPIRANDGGTEEEVGSSWVIINNIPDIPTHTIVGRYEDGTGPAAALQPPVAREIMDVGWLPITAFNATPVDQSIIELTDDLTAKVQPGMPLKIVTEGGTYYAKINSISSEHLTFYGALLLQDIDSLYYRGGITRQLSVNIPGAYEDASNKKLIVTDLKSCLKWALPTSYIVQYMVYSDKCDTGPSKCYVSVNINGIDVNSNNVGVYVAKDKTWYSTTNDIKGYANVVNTGDIIDIACVVGDNRDASDLTVEVYFVTP